MPKNSSHAQKYHIALSFAGEDRKYVDQVATHLVSEGVDVFYDKFDEANLWGKDLYTHLQDIYENKALFTVMFVSEHYKRKLWTNHERKSAQARAFTEIREYILPAFFDESVEVPGLLKTTGRISLTKRTPEELAQLIIKKLKSFGVQLAKQFAYSDEAKADVDFPLPKGDKIAELISALKSHNWYRQSPAVKSIMELDWSTLEPDQIFVLGRNIYQCACGEERSALDILNNLRRDLARLPPDAVAHLLNGMFFEAYFDKTGEFRSDNLKGRCLDKLLELQTVKKYSRSVSFIRSALQPYRAQLPFVPSTIPEMVTVEVNVRNSHPPMVKSLTLNGRDLLSKEGKGAARPSRLWKLSFGEFTIRELKVSLAEAWSIPLIQLEIKSNQNVDSKIEYRLPQGVSVRWPGPAISADE
jgi:TIR domain